MYYLIDLYQPTRTPLGSRMDVLIHWRFHLYHDWSSIFTPLLNFRDLNITGRDVYATEVDAPRLRRFQVVDKAGRSQDIRTWSKEISVVNGMSHFPWSMPNRRPPLFRAEPAWFGSKRTCRKAHCSSLTMQYLREQAGTIDPDFEDELLGFTPVRDSFRPRRMKKSCCPEYPYSRSSRSWKDGTKNAYQWGRHIECVKNMPIHKRVSRDTDWEVAEADYIGDDTTHFHPEDSSCESM